jgi:hypothetical protein
MSAARTHQPRRGPDPDTANAIDNQPSFIETKESRRPGGRAGSAPATRSLFVLCERLSRTLRYDCSARKAAQPAGVLSLANSGSPLVRLLWSCFCLRRSQPARDCSATARRGSGRCGASSCGGRLSVGTRPWAAGYRLGVAPRLGGKGGDNLVADRLSSTSVIPRFPASLFSARRRRGRRNVRPPAEPTARSGVRSHGG